MNFVNKTFFMPLGPTYQYKESWKFVLRLPTHSGQKEQRPCNAHMCVSTIYFPLFCKPNIAVYEKYSANMRKSFVYAGLYFSLF